MFEDILAPKELLKDLLRVGGEFILANEAAVLEHSFLQFLLAVLVVDLLLLP